VADMTVGNLIRGYDPIQMINLYDNVPSLTASSNDVSFTESLAICLNCFAKKGDLLFIISASGNSANLIKVMEAAKSFEMKVFSLTGFDGGRVRELSDMNVHVSSNKGDYGL
jgi:D-sedoheptulose 7-phosphate isomerase